MRLFGKIAAAGAMALGMAWTAQGEVTRERIDAMIELGVKNILKQQQDDGHWIYEPGPGGEIKIYQTGHTALAVLALQQCRSRDPQVSLAVKKGISYILQHAPEPQTYSAGIILQALYWDGQKDNSKMVGPYAWMLCGGQKQTGTQTGSWTYELPRFNPAAGANGPGVIGTPPTRRSDNSNTQFGVLGLVYAEKSGFQVPRVVWERARDYYLGAQHKDGGWDYQSDAYRASGGPEAGGGASTMTMTLAGTVSEYLCEEALADKKHAQCKTPPENKSHEAGLKWIADNWVAKTKNMEAYGRYATERLGMLIGYSEFGGHDWFQEGAEAMQPGACWPLVHQTSDASFSVLFLARGRTPIIINKLKRKGDWNLHRFDVGHLIDHISGPWQIPCQWRIVTLDAKVDFLLKVPIMWISGHEALKFTDEEKAKLKEYVEKGGTILAEDCCSRKPFDDSFKALLKELWPDNTLTDLPKTHAIYTSFRKLENPPELQAMALEKGQGRLGAIYIPHGISCKWETGGAEGRTSLDTGACIYLYVEKIGKATKVAGDAEAAK